MKAHVLVQASELMQSSEVLGQERIEFESDGLQDSLTHALAPAKFLEILTTELLKSHRSSGKIALVSAKCRLFSSLDEKVGNKTGNKTGNKNELNSYEELEEELKSFAETVSRLLRSGEEIGRLSEHGFWILIHGDWRATQHAVERFAKMINQEHWDLEICEREIDEPVKNLLRRMDTIHFTK